MGARGERIAGDDRDVVGPGGRGGVVHINGIAAGTPVTVYPVAGESFLVQASASGGATYLTVDDSADPTGRTFQPTTES